MPPRCTCLFCIGWLRNVQRFITRAEPLYDSLNPLFCSVFTAHRCRLCKGPAVVVYKKSRCRHISALFASIFAIKPRSHWKIPSEQNCATWRFPHRKSLYHSPMEISLNSHRNFGSNGKRPKKKLRIAGFFASLPFLTYLCDKRLKPSIHCVQLKRKIAQIVLVLSK